MRELATIRALAPLRRRFPGAIPFMTIVGLLSALAEGVGLSLVLPLLYSLEGASFDPSGAGYLGSLLQQAFAAVPAENRVTTVAIGIVCLALLKNVLIYGNEVLYGWMDTRLGHELRSRVAERLLSSRVAFAERLGSGRLLSTLLNQTWEASTALSAQAEILIRLSAILVFSTFLLLISWQLTLCVGAGLGLVSLVVRRTSREVERLSRRGVAGSEGLSQLGVEMLQRIRTMHLFGRAESERERFARVSLRTSRAFFHMHLLYGLVRPVSEILVVGLLALVLLTALDDLSNLPTVLTFAFILYRLRPHVQGLDAARIRLLTLSAPVATVMKFVDSDPQPELRSGPVHFERLREGIRFDRVSFRHPGASQPALHDVSFCIPRGRTTALVGVSGAGKSTAVELLARFYDPEAGSIEVDGVPLTQLDLASWRRRLGVARQDAQLFAGTVRENIAYGALEVSEEEIVRAAQLAGADAFIRELPEGYDTKIGDRGALLSDGQRQRISLARALVRDPEILILDEATNAVDEEGELALRDVLDARAGGRTVLLIAHRLSTLLMADRFVMLEGGGVREQGEPRELLRRRGLLDRFSLELDDHAPAPHTGEAL